MVVTCICMCICVYMYICICMYMYVDVCMCIYIYIYIYIERERDQTARIEVGLMSFVGRREEGEDSKVSVEANCEDRRCFIWRFDYKFTNYKFKTTKHIEFQKTT